MLKVLLRARLQGLFATMFGRYTRRAGGKGRRVGANKIGIGLLVVFIVGSLFFSFGAQFAMMARPMYEIGMSWLYFAMAGIMAILFCIVGSVFVTQSQLFASNDNDLLLSMPIKPAYILASRILTLLALNYIYAGLIMIPALAAYILMCGASAKLIIMFIASALLLPLVSMAIVCILGWVIALLASRMRKNNLVTNLMFIVGIGAYMVFAVQLQKYVQNLIINGAEIGAALQKALPPVYYFGKAAAGEGVINLLWLALICIIPFALVYVVLSRFFITIVTTNKGHAKIRYRERAMKASGAMTALIRKESARFFGTPIYLLNCGMGAVLHLLLIGALIWRGEYFVASAIGLPTEISMTAIMPGILCVCLAFCSMTVATSAVSISLEGRCFWILKSAPVSARQALNAKILFNMLCGGPTGLIASVLAVIIVPMDILSKIIVITMPVLALLFTALLGLVCNLLFPRLDWISEAAVVKQSMSVMVTMLGGMALVIGAGVAYIFLASMLSLTLYLLLIMLVLAAASAGLLVFLRTKGERIYEAL